MCRADVLPETAGSEEEVNFETWLDETVWADHLGVHCFSPVEAAWVRQSRYLIVYECFEDAVSSHLQANSDMEHFLAARYSLKSSARPELSLEEAEAMLEVPKQGQILADIELHMFNMLEIYEADFKVTGIGPTPEELLSEWRSIGSSGHKSEGSVFEDE